jgi:hypothetical protein
MIACPNKVDLQPVTEIANPRWIVEGTQSECAQGLSNQHVPP